MINVGSTDNSDLRDKFGAGVRLFSTRRDEPIFFEGEVSAKNLVNFVFENARTVI
jgi:hypothetical protein